MKILKQEVKVPEKMEKTLFDEKPPKAGEELN